MTFSVVRFGKFLRAALAGDPAAGPEVRRLRALAVIAGVGWALLFVAIGLHYELQTYADGSIFSYSVAVRDAWAFHWHNISGRLFVYLFCFVPAEAYVWLTGDPQGGIVAYGALFYVAPLLGLAATWAADRSRGRIIFGYACVSTACLCPLVFGFPTEMWLAHSLFWPSLALCHYAGRGIGGALAMLVSLLAMVLTHEGAVVFAGVILFCIALRGLHDPALRRTASVLALVMAVWGAVKIELPPDPYFASVLPAAAMNFIDISILLCHAFVLLAAALAIYGAVFVATARLSRHAELYAAVAVALLLAVYWVWFDHSVLAENRYYLRTALLAFTPAFGVVATAHALSVEGRLAAPLASLQRLLPSHLAAVTARGLAGALLVAMLVHGVETGRFVAAWTAYKSAIQALATGTASDPKLGDPRFVSSVRVATKLEPLAWSSTTQYLSVLLAPHFAPSRLVIDPAEDYFWLSCETATASRNAHRDVPVQSRALIGEHACQHRKRLAAVAKK